MIINKSECILCSGKEETVRLVKELIAEGYRSCTHTSLDLSYINYRHFGVRWMPTDTFPDCIAFVTEEFMNNLLEHGRCTLSEYSHDHGAKYEIRYYDGSPIQFHPVVEVGDLL